jgi:hypothetical protein
VDLGFAAIEKRFDDVATKDRLNAVYDLLDKNIHEHERQEWSAKPWLASLRGTAAGLSNWPRRLR